MSSPIKNVAIVGASGNIGSHIVKALLASSNPPTITAITREDSDSKFDSRLKVVKGSQDDPSFLASALANQDALIITLGIMAPPDTQHKLIDAAIAAGVKWVIPNEFGSDTNNADILATVGPMMGHKKDVREYIESKGQGKLKWIGIVNNPWTDYSLNAGMFGINIKDKTFTRVEPQARFNTTSLAQAGRAAAAVALAKEDVLKGYENKLVYVNSFHVTQQELFESVLKATGTKEEEWKVGSENVDEKIQSGKDAVATGNFMGAVNILYGATMKEGLGNGYAGELANGKLGLPKEELDELVRSVVNGA